MQTFTVDDNEFEKIKEVAEKRELPKYEKGVANKKFDRDRSKSANVEAHITGLMGEFAASIFLDTEIDSNFSLSGDAGYDLVLGDYITIEVKTRSKEGYAFALPDDNIASFNTDIGILAYRLDEKRVGLAGWTTKVHFLLNFTVMNFGYGDRLAVEPEDLIDITKLLELKDKIT